MFNHGDGRTVDVVWDTADTPRDWFFYTYRSTITRARVEDELLARRLVAFAFEGAQQDYAFFMSQPYWRERFLAADGGQDDEAGDVEGTEDDVVPSTCISFTHTCAHKRRRQWAKAGAVKACCYIHNAGQQWMLMWTCKGAGCGSKPLICWPQQLSLRHSYRGWQRALLESTEGVATTHQVAFAPG